VGPPVSEGKDDDADVLQNETGALGGLDCARLAWFKSWAELVRLFDYG
jgi:hypothetical protein